ncbi:hypothetical protein E1A91_A13G174800v1 [Gossypium mustelinum]|uniref:Uncharacterized protein n=1 Tax=Gossypium mustelinum TaxID=34275 RepID=A0A5D2WJ80_GOSMU|nr:hypothetical protein E1A91_A13G174800v1 [Gossypium mustelinum]
MSRVVSLPGGFKFAYESQCVSFHHNVLEVHFLCHSDCL